MMKIFINFIFSFVFFFHRLNTNYYNQNGWNSPDALKESIANASTSMINNFNNPSSCRYASMGTTTVSSPMVQQPQPPMNYRNGQSFFERNCHMGAGNSSSSSISSISPQSAPGAHSTNHLNNYWSHMNYYQV